MKMKQPLPQPTQKEKRAVQEKIDRICKIDKQKNRLIKKKNDELSLALTHHLLITSNNLYALQVT
ncbi:MULTISPECIES: hypothetical protein [Clostridiaceae]|uniref:hypothetical protein n=1 Tax=Clostridiaceae TaxID=31979 RepID=UPI000484606C|nr:MULTISPECIES: hypothetical protein [Clostridiaceae]